MLRVSASRWPLMLAAGALCLSVLSFYRPTSAAQREPREPFANAVQQRFEIIDELKAINALLKEQNALLRSGKVQVVIVEER